MARTYSPDVEAAIKNAVEKSGLPESVIRAYVGIESGGNPRNQTGSYLGLLQLSQDEFRKHGGTGNIFDPVANAEAGSRMLRARSDQFVAQHGRQPTAGELYLIHQQGEGGAAAHWRNPDAPAWQNMHSTGEGQRKGPEWAKQAIWRNVPTDVRQQFGSVDNITSRQFTDLWNQKVARFGGGEMEGGTVQPPSVTPQAPTQSVAISPPTPPLGDPDMSLLYANAFFAKQKEAENKADHEGAHQMALAKQAMPEAPGDSRMLNGPNPKKPDIGQLLAILKARGVSSPGLPVLGTDVEATLGTRRA